MLEHPGHGGYFPVHVRVEQGQDEVGGTEAGFGNQLPHGGMLAEAAGATNHWGNREALMMESLLSIKRAGANQILTYFATEVAQKL